MKKLLNTGWTTMELMMGLGMESPQLSQLLSYHLQLDVDD
jgi:hypothetical protein